jgi:hypothetical protein
MNLSEFYNIILQINNQNKKLVLFINFSIVFLSFFLFKIQKDNFTTTTLIHSKVFPFETFTNIIEPTIIAVKHNRINEIQKNTGLSEDDCKSINKINLKKIEQIKEKVEFSGMLFYLTVETDLKDYEKNKLIVKKLLEKCNKDEFTKNQVDIIVSNKKKRLDNLEKTINSFEKFDSLKLDSKNSKILDIGKMYESSGNLFSQYEELSIDYQRILNTFQILSTSQPYMNVKIPFLLIYFFIFFIFNSIYYGFWLIKKF